MNLKLFVHIGIGLAAAGSACRAAPPPRPSGDTTVVQHPSDTSPPGRDSAESSDTVGSVPTEGDTARRMATLDDLRNEVIRMIGDAGAANAGLCRTIAFGAKPCGGPRQYLVYSASTTDSAALAAAVARYNALESEINSREGRVSDCMVVTPPPSALIGGRCSVAAAETGGK